MKAAGKRDVGSGRRPAVALVCFLASGASGLVYQVVWMRELTLVFGATTLAVSTVLAVFMGGLAIGSLAGGRLADRTARPLRAYAFLEVGIGLYGLVVPLLFSALPSLYQPLWRAAGLSFIGLSIVRFLLAGAVLLVPTILMGATLPVLSRFFATGPDAVARDVGALYTTNTVGAVLGAAAAGLVLIPWIGLVGTTLVAAGSNFIAAALAFAVSRSRERSHATSGADANPRAASRDERESAGKRVNATIVALYAAFAMSGLAALVCEVAWTRALALVLGSSVYAFTIMLTTFLIGLALGSGIGTWLAGRSRRPLLSLTLVELGVGASAFAGLFLIRELPYLFVVLFRSFEGSPAGLLLMSRLILSMMVMLVPTTLLGMVFPLAVRAAATRFESLGRTVGALYSVNTLGAIAGSFAAGFVLIPLLGVRGSLVAAVALNLAAATLLALAAAEVDRPVRAALAVALSGAIGLSVVFAPVWDPSVMASGVYRYAPSMKSATRKEFYEHFASGGDGETLFYRDGVSATVAVQQQHGYFVLKVNGKPDATTAGDLPTQSLIAHIPLLVHSDPKSVLVVGWGSGVSVGSVLTHPVEHVTSVELEPAVVEASRFFEGVNRRPLEDPRLELLINDGRNYLAATDRRFDVIVSEPSNPWLSGVANLFTREYFEAGAAHLAPGGLFCQWLQIYEMQPSEVATLVGTFSDAFPTVFLFRGASGDLILLGSRDPITLDPERMNDRIQSRPDVVADLKRIGSESAGAVLSRLYLTPTAVRGLAAGAPRNTDDNARIEFLAPLHVGIANEVTEQSNVDTLEQHSEPVAPFISGATTDLLNEMALNAVSRGEKARATRFLQESLAIGDTVRARSILGEIAAASDLDEQALEQWQRAVALDPDDLATNLDLGKYYLTKNNIDGALERLDRAVTAAPESARAHHLRGLALQIKGDAAGALAEIEKARSDAAYAGSMPVLDLHYGRALRDVGRYDESLAPLTEYTSLEPRDPLGFFELAQAEQIIGDRTLDAASYARSEHALLMALTIDPTFADAHRLLSLVYRKQGRFSEAEAEFNAFEQYSRSPGS